MSQELMYKELLEVKKVRQNRSVEDLHRKKRLLAQARQLVENSVSSLEAYAKLRKYKQDEIYDFLISNQGLSPRQLELWRNKLAKLKENEIVLREKMKEAKNEYKKAQEALEKTREEYLMHSRNVKKFEEVVSVIGTENRKIEEAAVELEVEDLFQKANELKLFTS